MRQRAALHVIVLAVGAAVGRGPQTADAFAPPSPAHFTASSSRSSSTGSSTSDALRPIRRSTSAAPSTGAAAPTVRLNLMRRTPSEEDLSDLEREIRDLEAKISNTQNADRILLGLLAGSIFLALDGATCAYAQSDLPFSDILVSASSSTPDYLNEVVGALEYVGEVARNIFGLIFQVLAAVLPIVGKAAVVAGKAALPVVSKATVSFLEHLGVAFNESSEAAKPYLDEASKAAQPLLEQAGSTAKEAASAAGAVVTTKAAALTEPLSNVAAEQIKSIQSAAEGAAEQVSNVAAEQVKSIQSVAEEAASAVTAPITGGGQGFVISAPAPATPPASSFSPPAEQQVGQATAVAVEQMKAVSDAIHSASERTGSPLPL